MGIATVFVIPSNIEPWFWLLIFGECAFLIARGRSSLHFLHGLPMTYIANHSKETAMMKSMPSQCQIRKINCQDNNMGNRCGKKKKKNLHHPGLSYTSICLLYELRSQPIASLP
jgi:hypothetical protein